MAESPPIDLEILDSNDEDAVIMERPPPNPVTPSPAPLKKIKKTTFVAGDDFTKLPIGLDGRSTAQCKWYKLDFVDYIFKKIESNDLTAKMKLQHVRTQFYQLFSEYEHQKPMVAKNVSSCVGCSSHSFAPSGVDHEEDMEVDVTGGGGLKEIDTS
ncbi:zinc finger BED domain-containing protein RICESLEEPER 2-like [Fagus crenata]